MNYKLYLDPANERVIFEENGVLYGVFEKNPSIDIVTKYHGSTLHDVLTGDLAPSDVFLPYPGQGVMRDYILVNDLEEISGGVQEILQEEG